MTNPYKDIPCDTCGLSWKCKYKIKFNCDYVMSIVNNIELPKCALYEEARKIQRGVYED